MVSLCKLMEVTEEGVNFQSPHDGSMMQMTPEHSMYIQNIIGADIMMALDDVVSSKVTGPRVEEAMHRSIRWLDRCIKAHSRPQHQNLFAIIQGGLDSRLRDVCLAEMIQRDTPGFAIGGLSGGESKDDFWRIVHQCTSVLPEGKPRYLMGVGYAEDLVVCSALGVDMYDCVFPTRTARFGSALRDEGALNLKKDKLKDDIGAIDPQCECRVCQKYSRAYLHSLISTRDMMGCILITYHNVAYQMGLMRRIRAAMANGSFESFVQQFMRKRYATQSQYPGWIGDALQAAGMKVCYENPKLETIGEGAETNVLRIAGVGNERSESLREGKEKEEEAEKTEQIEGESSGDSLKRKGSGTEVEVSSTKRQRKSKR